MKDKYLILYETGRENELGVEKNSMSGLTAEDILNITSILDDLGVKYQVYVIDLSM